MRKEIVAAGFGGQGIVFMGIIAATAAGIYDDKEVAQSQSYGPSARGGACRTEVILSDEKIDYGKSIKPDVMVLMSQPAKEKYLGELEDENTILIIDSSLVENVSEKFKNVYKIPATDIAEKELGNVAAANMVILGAVSSITNLISLDGIKSAVRQKLENKQKVLELNLTAIDKGYQYGKNILHGSDCLNG
ncbi:2-oxoacid:ferredoxin oxidoreductase subunit gamma [Thermanaerosceptrum fracticalcis]|uniref:2-oxoacid:ferredoxin oxidoreductase subunit gamma n=1 Tax=Thermanaerosceptrum fracticalcis TaxID=1712410 RepID=A0A7G6E539_THEFR|nr:2-oxoacid:acceptor oxidoreductase family protein [Thermanaerosceptrum fracticalcis]QNB47193.1 2-oxoacid:ferredoxin oxidoreductase subunit gamma [Thermanaerosceptrum fracticalcis]